MAHRIRKHRNDYNHGKCGWVGGNPRYAGKGFHRGLRARNRFNMQNALAELQEPAPASKEPQSYRVIVSTQIYENYGWCDWDGTGPCPQYWKAKGGNDYIVAENLTEYDVLVTSPEMYFEDTISHRSEGFQEEIISIQFVPTTEECYTETMVREMSEWGCMKPAEAQRILDGMKRHQMV